MTDSVDDLIKRLEQATGPSRELSARVAIAAFPDKYAADDYDLDKGYVVYLDERGKPFAKKLAPRFAESLDAALTLVPAGIWLEIKTGTQKSAPSWEWPVVEIGDQDTGDTIWKGQAKTLPLALCIASLKARKAAERVT